MNNKEIARIFQDIADILEYKKENIFKVRAYGKIAHTIFQLPTELEIIVREGRLREIPGVGEAIERKIVELVNTGKLEFYERVKADVPKQILELLAVPGIGPKTCRILVDEFKINTIDELEKAILEGWAAVIPHIGEKGVEKILSYIQARRNNIAGQTQD